MIKPIEASATKRSRRISAVRRYILITNVVQTTVTLAAVWGYWLLGASGHDPIIIPGGLTLLIVMLNGTLLIRGWWRAPRLVREPTEPLTLTHI